MLDPARSLVGGSLQTVEHCSERVAVKIGAPRLTAQSFHNSAKLLFASVPHTLPSDGPPLTVVFATRSMTAGVDVAIARASPLSPNRAGTIEALLTSAAVDLATACERLNRDCGRMLCRVRPLLIDCRPVNSKAKSIADSC